MRYIYYAYQLVIALPLIVLASIVTSLVTVAGCFIGDGHFWGYHPGRLWAKFIVRILLLPIKVEGREHLAPRQSYVFVSNHQGAFDVFIIYGYLGRNFKWMMKRALRKMPFVGAACAAAHHIFVDKSGPRKVKQTYDQARATLKDGMSLVVFPEGARTFTGHMGLFRRGAFMLADELQLPVCPLTINGSFDVLPRMRDGRFVSWHPLRLTIHEPIMPQGNGPEALQQTMSKAYDAIMESLDEQYKGFRENPDQK